MLTISCHLKIMIALIIINYGLFIQFGQDYAENIKNDKLYFGMIRIVRR
jgi:hypothetical protein